jgi:glutamine synthetase
MTYTRQDVLDYVEKGNIRFIRLTFFDVFGVQKNVSVMPNQLEKAFEKGIAFNPQKVAGFENCKCTAYLKPDPSTMALIPWRSSQTGVIYMICDIIDENGRPLGANCRDLLKKAAAKIYRAGLDVEIAAKFQFYLFNDPDKNPITNGRVPLDNGGYMDVAPVDKGEEIRRQICLTLEQMGLEPRKSYHQSGPGQNEIDFHFTDILSAADDASLFKWVVKTAASMQSLQADFSQCPVENAPENMLRIQMRLYDFQDWQTDAFLDGILRNAKRVLPYMRSKESSSEEIRMQISSQDRNVFIRRLEKDMIEIRFASCTCNPYLVFALLLESGLCGLEQTMTKLPALPAAVEKAYGQRK